MTDESTWLVELTDRQRDEVVEGPGVLQLTVGEWLDFHGLRTPPAGVELVQNAVYGTAGAGGRDLTMHVYRPVDPSVPRPGIVFVHGGGWAGGHPFMHLRHSHELAARGYTTATISYRLSPEAPWPAALEDAKCAVRWMRARHAELGVDPDRIAVSGGSAGGHLACMVALTPGHFEGAGGNDHVSSEVQAAAVWYPMTDMSAPGNTVEAEVDPIIRSFLGSRDDDIVRESSPITHVHPGGPPILSMTGADDPLTTVGMIRTFHDALDAVAVPNRLEVFEGRTHAFDFYPDDWERCFAIMVEWFDSHLGAGAPIVSRAAASP